MLAHFAGKICQDNMSIVQLDPKLRSRQSFNYNAFCSNFIFFFCHSTSLFTISSECLSFTTTNCFLLFHAALFALGDEPTFATNSAQHLTLDNFLAKALEQGVLRFTVA